MGRIVLGVVSVKNKALGFCQMGFWRFINQGVLWDIPPLSALKTPKRSKN
ncbi:hypothetical protein [Helicobacter pylori]|nr:hypothetical protein [Helicobacter pylori]